MSRLLEAENINTSYGSSRVLFGISLDIKLGERVGRLGHDGTGKTTTMRSIV